MSTNAEWEHYSVPPKTAFGVWTRVYRLRVPGGDLYRTERGETHDGDDNILHMAVTFVPERVR